MYGTKKKDSKEYYYRCYLTKCEIDEYVEKKNGKDLDNIKWRTMDNIHEFETSREDFIRIKRSEYEKSNKILDTPLMQITKFVKENRDVILHTIEMAPVQDFDKYCNKAKQQGNIKYERSGTLCYLSNKYKEWVGK